MHTKQLEKINVLAVFASFKQRGIDRKIVPRQFVRSNGELHTIKKVVRSYIRNEHINCYHFIVITAENRSFNIAYNNKKMYWYLLFEFEDERS